MNTLATATCGHLKRSPLSLATDGYLVAFVAPPPPDTDSDSGWAGEWRRLDLSEATIPASLAGWHEGAHWADGRLSAQAAVAGSANGRSGGSQASIIGGRALAGDFDGHSRTATTIAAHRTLTATSAKNQRALILALTILRGKK